MATVFILSSLKHSMITLFSPVPNQNIPVQKITMHLHTVLLTAQNYFSRAHILAVHLIKIGSQMHIISMHPTIYFSRMHTITVRLTKIISHAHTISLHPTIYFLRMHIIAVRVTIFFSHVHIASVRPIKIAPCHPKKSTTPTLIGFYSPHFSSCTPLKIKKLVQYYNTELISLF